MLTPKQSRLLAYIHKIQQERGASPSFEEMMLELGLKSKSGIFRLIRALEERGFVRKLPYRARALEILRLPSGETFDVPPLPTTEARDSREETAFSRHELPLYGTIAAGTPIDALQTEGETIFVPEGMLGKGEHFALNVSGDSMRDAGILDGDQILVRRADTAASGEIVIALIDQDVATLKTLKISQGATESSKQIELHPANPHYDIQVYEPERVQIQGLLVGLLRQY